MRRDPNPWRDRFDELSDHGVIRSRTVVPAQHLPGLPSLPAQEAQQHLEVELERLFVPTKQACTLIERFIESARTTSEQRYTDARGFIKEVYREKSRPEHNATPVSMPEASRASCRDEEQSRPEQNATPVACWCLTGLAGVGKSHLLAALERLCATLPSLSLGDAHAGMPHRPMERLIISQGSKEVALLERLASPAFLSKELGGRSNIEDLREHVTKYRYNLGTVLLVLDEMQFLTQSQAANTQIAKTLTLMMMLRMPIVFAANYSLIRRLLRRPHEERQRFLARPIGMAPDEPDSACWLAVVAEYLKVSPEMLPTALLDHACEMHRLSSGLPRVLKRLLVVAFRIAHQRSERRVVTIGDVRQAYLDGEFSTDRTDVEALAALAINPDHGSYPDLVCPFEGLMEASDSSRFQRARDERAQKVAASVLRSSLTVAEREALEAIELAAARNAGNDPAEAVVRLPRRPKVTAASLAAGSRALAKQLGKTPLESVPAAPQADHRDV